MRDPEPQPLDIELCGERVLLHPDRALVWPRRSLAVVADPHFGKDDAFRRAGIALPAGAATTDLARLEALVRAHSLARLVVLGDFFHAAPAAADTFFAGFSAFRARHPSLAIDVVAGNHDRHGGVRELRDAVTWHDDTLDLEPFAFRHDPAAASTRAAAMPAAGSTTAAVPMAGADSTRRRYVLAGHLHPVHVIADRGDRARLPVFWIRPDHGVLPAFGSLTGGWRVAPGPGDRLYAAVGARVIALPANGRAA